MKTGSMIAALTLLSLPLALNAQTAAPEFSADRVRAHVEFLADDKLEGRNAGTRGYDLAAHYVASQFQALGLKQATESWYQQVPMVEIRHAGEASLTIAGKRFANAGDVLIGPSSREAAQAISGDVVFVGFGLDKPELGFNDYAGLDVRGKVVAYLTGFPKGTPSDIGAHLGREKSRMAEARGAIGVISVATLEQRARVKWENAVRFAGVPSLMWTEADGAPYSAAPGIRFGAVLNVPALDVLFAGAPRTLAAVLAEADKTGGKPRGFALKAPVKFERTRAERRFTTPNVLAVLPGSDPALANEYVVLMAHLDHDGVDEKLTGDKIYNGAMDNAAGTATMLEVARAMATAPNRPKRSILFAAVTAEEDGLLGSDYLARHPVIKGGKVVGVVNLDMPVLLYDFTDVVAFGAEHSTLGPIVATAAAADGVTLSPDPMPAEGLFTRSDHYSFVKQGVPSIFLVTGFANGGGKIFGEFLATHYHKVSDQPDLPFNWNAGAKFARINYGIARAIADAPTAPVWYEDSFFGKTFAAAQTKAKRPAN